MNWYWIVSPEGVQLYQVFAMTMEDLAANVPFGHTVTPVIPVTE
jgi:hypothetical protein